MLLTPVSASSVEGYFYPGGYYGGSAGYYEWEDFCPLCHHSNCLGTYVKGVNEITCYACDADYDGCTGGDKSWGGARAWLTPYEAPEPEVPIVQAAPAPAPPQTVKICDIEVQKDLLKNVDQYSILGF